MALEEYETFESVKCRLDEILDAVNDESLPLEEALALYEEAVGLGLRASSLLEEGIEERRSSEEAAGEHLSAEQSSADSVERDDSSNDRVGAASGASNGVVPEPGKSASV